MSKKTAKKKPETPTTTKTRVAHAAKRAPKAYGKLSCLDAAAKVLGEATDALTAYSNTPLAPCGRGVGGEGLGDIGQALSVPVSSPLEELTL